MKLSDEQFHETLSALGCGTQDSKADRRNQIRVPIGTTSTIIPCSASSRREPMTVVVMNLSESGTCILNNVEMRRGDQFILRVPAGGKRGVSGLLCTVMHSHRVSDGMYAVGAQYCQVLSVPPGGGTGEGSEARAEAKTPDMPPDPHIEDADHIRGVEDRLRAISL